jgi:hypothetical protein
MLKRLVLSAALAAAVPLTAGRAAQPITLKVNNAGDLADLCSAPPNSAGADARLNFCDGYADGVVSLQLEHATDKKPFCFPPGMNRRVTMDGFAKWVQGVPAHRSAPAPRALVQYLTERFPCH